MKTRHAHHIVLSCGCLLALAGTAQAQPALDFPPGSTDLATGPMDLPGEELGPRTRAPAKPEAKPDTKAEPRDWFGGKPFWEWGTLTGDWAGARTALAERGLTVNASYNLDWAGVWSGGVTRRASTRHLFDFNAKADLEKMVGLKGATVYADVQITDSRVQTGFVGAQQSTSVLETGRNIRQLSELWYEQVWFDGVLRTKVGKIDTATEFASVKAADLFTHSGGVSPRTLAFQPTYPDASTGALVFVYPCENAYIGGGVFDGSLSAGVLTGGQGPKSWFHGDENWYIAEAGITWKGTECDFTKNMGSGRIAGGYWYHSGQVARFDGTPSSHFEGGYALMEQQIFKNDPKAETDTKGLFAFAHGGVVTESVSTIDWSIAGGLTLRGTFAGRDDDAVGFMVSHAHLSRASGSTVSGQETAFEVFYNCQATPWLSVRPYMQYIKDPSGDAPTGNATVGGLRVQVSF